MYTNLTIWDTFQAANDVGKTHESDSPIPGLIEGLSGAAAVVLILIGIAIAVRKNLEAVRGVLEQLQDILTVIANAMRKRFPTANPPPPPNETRARNYTDDEIIEMREQMERIYSQEDHGVSRSVWI